MNAEKVRALFAYNPATGVLTWKERASGHVGAGEQAGTESHGYRRVKVAGRPHAVHRLIWLHVYGEWPKGQIDHINGDKSDNRVDNLRDVSASVNGQNRHKPAAHNKVGLLGVRAAFHRFQAIIKHNGKQQFLGSFDTAEEAHAAYLEAKRQFHEGCAI